MPTVIENVVRFSFVGTWTNGEPVVNTISAEVEGADPGVTRAEAIELTAEDITENWQSQLVAIFANNYTFLGTEWVDLDSLEGMTGFQAPVVGEPTTGGTVSTAAPPSNAVRVDKISDARTRGRRNGRWYLPLATDGNIDENGNVLAATQTTVRNACLAFRDNVNQDSLPDGRFVRIGVVSDPATLPALHLRITDFTVRPVVGTQRRRLTTS